MSLITWLKNRRSNTRRKRLDEAIGYLVSEGAKCQEIISRIEETYGIRARALDLPSLSSYFFIDMLEQAFAKANISLSSEINVLDVGVAGWYYAPVLLTFLQSWQGPRTVNLEGIDFPRKDYRKAISKLQKEWDLKMHWGDVMDFYPASQYDIIFINHMLTGPDHCRKWKVPYHPFSELLPSIQSLGKPGSLVVITAHTWAGESAIRNCFADESKLVDFIYDPEVEKNLSSFLNSCFGFHDNAICICRSPYVDFAKCQQYDKDKEEWDEIFRKL